EVQAAGLHPAIVQDERTPCPSTARGRERSTAVSWTGDRTDPRPRRLAAHRALGRHAGPRVHGLRPTRARGVDRAVRPDRAGGRGVAATRLGGRSAAGARAPPPVRVLPPGAG